MADEAQLALPFALDRPALETFLAQWVAIEDEEERLRGLKQGLRVRFQDELPLRAVLTALKVTRAQRKLAAHPTESLARPHQATLEALVETILDAQAAEVATVSTGLAESA